jgi:hypothetical protein
MLQLTLLPLLYTTKKSKKAQSRKYEPEKEKINVKYLKEKSWKFLRYYLIICLKHQIMTTGLSTQTETGNLPNTNFPVLMKNFSLIRGRKTLKPR